MTTISFILLFAFCIGAAFVQRVSGFGFGIFIMTILPYLMPSYGEATALSGILAMVTSAIIVAKMWRHLSVKSLMPILLTFIVVSFFGVQFVAHTEEHLLKKILGVILIVASVYFCFISEKIRLRPTLPVQISMGTLSGIMGGLFGMQGPPAVLYFLASSNTKEQYIALAQTYFLVGNLMMTIFRFRSGFLTVEVCHAWCYGIAGVLLGTWIGNKVFKRISLPTLRKVVYLFIAVSGVIALIS